MKKLTGVLVAGLLAVNAMAPLSVFAASAGGSSVVTYSPGKSTGTDDDGNLSDWTVDYPVKVVLDDSTIDYASGSKLKFSLVNTTNFEQAYSGQSTVQVYAKGHQDILNQNYRGKLKMRNSNDQPQEAVLMQIGKSSSANVQFAQNGNGDPNYKEKLFDLSRNSLSNESLKAFLCERSGAVKGETYHQTVTWYFTDQTT